MKCDDDEEDEVCPLVLYEANVSVVILGWDHYRWVGWAFSNTLSDPTCLDEVVDGVYEDHFASDGNGPVNSRLIEADKPIWDPREYWLNIVNIRMSSIYEEWRWLVMNIARRIGSWVRLATFLVCELC